MTHKLAFIAALAAALAASGPTAAEVVVRGIEGRPLQEARPAPAFLDPDFKIVVAQPSPSEINPSFLGPVLLMKSAQVDLEKGTAKLPLYRGRVGDTPIWFTLTDSTDENLSDLHGLNYSPKMAYGVTGKAAREAVIERDGSWAFDAGLVDFAPEMRLTPGAAPNPFPPSEAKPGSVGDADYSPLVRVTNAGKDVVFNAPVLAAGLSEEELNGFCDAAPDRTRVHDKVVAICPRDGTVTVQLTTGFTFGRPILYLSTDANDELIATLEASTFAPAMKDLPFANEDAQPGEAAERIYAFANGPTGLDSPIRQGVGSALTDGRGPLNVLGGVPTFNLDYSPMWRLFPAKWTEEAIERGYRTRMTDAIHIEDMAAKGFITSLDDGELRPLGFIINCPVVYRVN